MSEIIVRGIPISEWIDLHEILNQTPKTSYWTKVRNYSHILGFTEEDYQLLLRVLKGGQQ